MLYIPLSSDKTKAIKECIERMNDFISHLVQIKLDLLQGSEKTISLYIPLSSDKTVKCDDVAGLGDILYIPLSSDKTQFWAKTSANQIDFISHLVQIKLIFLSANHHLLNTLYPT